MSNHYEDHVVSVSVTSHKKVVNLSRNFPGCAVCYNVIIVKFSLFPFFDIFFINLNYILLSI